MNKSLSFLSLLFSLLPFFITGMEQKIINFVEPASLEKWKESVSHFNVISQETKKNVSNLIIKINEILNNKKIINPVCGKVYHHSVDTFLEPAGKKLAKLLFNKKFFLKKEIKELFTEMNTWGFQSIVVLCIKYINCMYLNKLMHLLNSTQHTKNKDPINKALYFLGYSLIPYELLVKKIYPIPFQKINITKNYFQAIPTLVLLENNKICIIEEMRAARILQFNSSCKIIKVESLDAKGLVLLFFKDTTYFTVYNFLTKTQQLVDKCLKNRVISHPQNSQLIAYILPNLNANQFINVKICNLIKKVSKICIYKIDYATIISFFWHPYNKNLLVFLYKNYMLKICNLYNKQYVYKLDMQSHTIGKCEIVWHPRYNFVFAIHSNVNVLKVFDLLTKKVTSFSEENVDYRFRKLTWHPRYEHVLVSLGTIESENLSIIRLWDIKTKKSLEGIPLYTLYNYIHWTNEPDQNCFLQIGQSDLNINHQFSFPLLDACFNSPSLEKLIYLQELTKLIEKENKNHATFLLEDLMEI